MHHISKRGLFYDFDCCWQKGKTLIEEMLPDCAVELQNIYNHTKEWNGQRWLMIDLEDKERLYNDILRFIQIRRNS